MGTRRKLRHKIITQKHKTLPISKAFNFVNIFQILDVDVFFIPVYYRQYRLRWVK